MSVYNADGAIRVSVSDGNGFKGLYAPNGSIWVTEAPTTGFVGAYAPDGSLYVTVATSPVLPGKTAPNGSAYVRLTGTRLGDIPLVEVVSGYLGFVELLTDPDTLFTVVRSGTTATYFDETNTIQDAAANTLRYDHRNEVSAGWLIESSVVVEGKSGGDLRTNAEGNPLSLWSASSTTATSGFTAPDGTTTACKIVASGGSAVHSRASSVSTASAGGQTHSTSILAKAAELNTLSFGFVSADGWAFCTFTLTGSGSVGSFSLGGVWSAGVARIFYVGNGYYKLFVNATNAGTAVAARIYPGTSASYNNDGAGVICWGFNMALNTEFTGSYVRNTSSQVTRNSDDVSILLSNLPNWNNTEGTMVLDFAIGGNVGSKYLLDISDGTTSNRLRVFTTSLGTLGFWVTVGGVSHTQIYSGGNITPFSRNKVAISFKENEFYISANGNTVGSNLSGAMPIVDRMQLGANLSKTASTFLNGHEISLLISSLAYGSAVQDLSS